MFAGRVDGERRCGGACILGDKLYIASPADNRILEIDADTCAQRILTIKRMTTGTNLAMFTDGIDLWILPYDGKTIVRWNPETREIQEYSNYPAGIKCIHTMYGNECEQRPFGNMTSYKDYIYFAPYFSNMYICLNKVTGEMTEWKPTAILPEKEKNGYFSSMTKSFFTAVRDKEGIGRYHLFSCYDKNYYNIDFESDECKKVEIEFDQEQLKSHEPGFWECSQWLQYACEEDSFNSLPDFLDGNVTGAAFDRERQIKAYGEIAANHDGSSGEKIYSFVRKELQKR